jgi:hypothetical protein
MKPLWFVPAFLGALLLTGCQQASTGKPGTEDALKKAKEAFKAEAAVFRKEMKEHLASLDKQYEEWKAKAATASGDAKVKMTAKLAELDKYKASVNDQFTKLESASAEMWKEAKEDAHKAMTGLKEAFEKGKEHFK